MRILILATVVFSFQISADIGCDYSMRSDVEMIDNMRMGNSERVIHLTDAKDSSYFAHATLRKGVMNFTVKTRDDRRESKAIHAEDAFQFLLSRFGTEVKEIRCFWRWGEDHKKVNELTANGVDLETAVKMTWDARQVMGSGFTKYEIVDSYGRPGKYREVEVIFRKP